MPLSTDFVLTFDLLSRTRSSGIITCFIMLISAYPAYTQEIQLTGTITCADCDSGLHGISVLVYPGGSESTALLAFTFTDNQGTFNLEFMNPDPIANDSVQVLFRSIKFAETDTTLSLPDDTSMRIHLEMTLHEDVQKLEEIVVQARSPLFEVRGDTLFFFIESQRDQYDRNLNDLLDRLPGLEVDHESGNIRYLGKNVSYLLLDGDDLTGNQYEDLGRLLNPAEVEGVQLFTDHQQNRLLKGLQPGEIALNIELKDSLLIKPKITLSGGALSNKRALGQIQPEIIALQKRHKWVVSSGVLNTGEDFSAFGSSTIEEIVQGGQQHGGRNFQGNIHRESDLSRSNYVENRQTYLNINHLYSNDKQLRWRTSIQADLQEGGMRRETREEFLNPSLELTERVGDTSFRFDHGKLQATTSAELDVGPDTRSETQLIWRYFDQNSNQTFTNPSVANGSELARRKQHKVELNQELTHRPIKNKLYSARFNYVYLNADHRKNLFQSLLQMPELEKNGYQDLLEQYRHASVLIETTRTRFANTRITTFLDAETKREEINLRAFASPFIFSNLPEIGLEAQLVRYLEVATGQQYSNQFGPLRWFLEPSLKFTQIRIDDGSSSNTLLGEAESRIELEFDSNTSFTVELQRHHETPVSQIFLAFPILQSNQSIVQGSMQPDLIPTNRINLNLRYFGTEVNDPFALIMGSLTHRERLLIVDQQIEPEFTFNQYRTGARSGITGVIMANLNQDFHSLNLGYKSDISFFYHEFLISQQDDAQQQVQSWIWKPSLTMFYRYRRWLVLESGVSWGRMLFQSSGFGAQHQQDGRLSAKVDVRMRKFQLITHYQQIRPNLRQTVDVRLLGTELRYKSDPYSLEIRLIFNNLLNQTFYDRNRLSDLGKISSRLELVPPSGLLELSWNF